MDTKIQGFLRLSGRLAIMNGIKLHGEGRVGGHEFGVTIALNTDGQRGLHRYISGT